MKDLEGKHTLPPSRASIRNFLSQRLELDLFTAVAAAGICNITGAIAYFNRVIESARRPEAHFVLSLLHARTDSVLRMH